jgi:hypothetical protein
MVPALPRQHHAGVRREGNPGAVVPGQRILRDTRGIEGARADDLPVVVAGCLLVFIPAVGEFVIPDLLGGSRTLMIGRTLWSEFFANRDWPVASAVAIILLLILVVPIMFFQRAQARAQERDR